MGVQHMSAYGTRRSMGRYRPPVHLVGQRLAADAEHACCTGLVVRTVCKRLEDANSSDLVEGYSHAYEHPVLVPDGSAVGRQMRYAAHRFLTYEAAARRGQATCKRQPL